MCEVPAIPRSTYYKSLDKTISNPKYENEILTQRMIEIHKGSKTRYGAPKIHRQLKKDGYTVSIKRVRRPMRKEGIHPIHHVF